MGRKRKPQAHNYSIEKLLGNYIYNVPEYQRCYSWGQKELGDLFSDIEEAVANNDETYMSTIVTLYKEEVGINNTTYRCVDLVDGQQRITTIVLMLKSIWLIKKNNGIVDSTIENLLIKKGDSITRNVLSQGKHKSSTILSNFILNGDMNPSDTSTNGQRKLKNAINYCYRFIRYNDYLSKNPNQERDLPSIDAIKETLLKRFHIVYYELPEEKVVYKTFESLNGRGLPVAKIDNFKSQIMGIAFAANDKQACEDLHNIWSGIYDVIGEEKIVEDDILSISATLYKALDDKKSRPKTVDESMQYFYDVAKKIVEYKNTPRELVQDDPSLDTQGNRCKKISNLLSLIASEMVSIHKNKRLDALTDIKQARVLLIAIRISKYTEAEKQALLDAWEKTTFRLFCLHRKDARSFVGEYIECAENIIEGLPASNVQTKIKEIGEKYTFDKGLELVRHSDWYPAYNNDIIYIMRRYDEYLCEQSGQTLALSTWEKIWESDASETIEHIFPKTYPKKKSKIEKFKKDWQHGGKRFNQEKLDEFVHNIGNLTILEPGVNGKAEQKPYNEKIALYGNTMHIHPDLNSKYLKKGYWTKESIYDREEDLLDFIKNTWG